MKPASVGLQPALGAARAGRTAPALRRSSLPNASHFGGPIAVHQLRSGSLRGVSLATNVVAAQRRVVVARRLTSPVVASFRGVPPAKVRATWPPRSRGGI